MGVGFASVFASMTWDAGRCILASLFVITIIAGEAFNLLATAERLITSREAAQKPLLNDADARQRAEKRVEDAEAAVARSPITSPRLEKAWATKTEVDAAVVDKSAERGCKENCRQLLQAQVDAAIAAVADAQVELGALKAKAEAELAAARTALEQTPKPASSTPLADRVGVSAWVIDMVTSALGSVAANGLACGLLIFGTHHLPRGLQVVRAPTKPRRKACPIKEHAAQFAVQCLRPGGETPLQDLDGRYRAWRGADRRYPKSQVGSALAALFEEGGLSIEERADELVVVGVSLKDAAPPAD
jgi:hypothetical protein